jgi:hypothetical protein
MSTPEAPIRMSTGWPSERWWCDSSQPPAEVVSPIGLDSDEPF